ncbi:MAG: LacI family DNA-binding transcriptional regulator, partial [Bacteroidota bacterium]
MKKEATLKDIAKVLNVSPATVSRALHDDYQISKSTKEKVLALAKEMDYAPNPIALGLLHKKTHIVGVIIPDIAYHFNSSAISGIENVLNAAGYSVIVCQSKEDFRKEAVHLKNLMLGRTDGTIISIAHNTKDFQHFSTSIQKGYPLVFLDRAPPMEGISSVTIDNVEATKQATTYLIGLGCRNIAYVAGPEGLEIGKKRYEGYLKAHREAGIKIHENYLVHCKFDHSMGKNAVTKLLLKKPKPDAILTINDRIAIGTMAAIRAWLLHFYPLNDQICNEPDSFHVF